jgi:hypothetical protein
MIAAGQFKGRGVKGSVQLGESESGTLQIGINMSVYQPGQEPLGQMTTFLYFSPAAAPYSYERLRALGWKGNGPEDISEDMEIDTNEVDVRVTQAEPYKAPDGTMKMGVSKLEILTGGGTVTMNKKVDRATFQARLKAIGGSSGGGGASTAPGTSPTKPPF